MITALTTLNLSLHKSSMNYTRDFLDYWKQLCQHWPKYKGNSCFDILIILNNQQLQRIICFWIGKMIENTPFLSCNFKNKDYINSDWSVHPELEARLSQLILPRCQQRQKPIILKAKEMAIAKSKPNVLITTLFHRLETEKFQTF